MPSSRSSTEAGTSEPPTKRARVEADAESDSTPNGGRSRRVTEGQETVIDYSDEEEDATRRRRKAAAAAASQPSDMYLDTVMSPCLITVTSSHIHVI